MANALAMLHESALRLFILSVVIFLFCVQQGLCLDEAAMLLSGKGNTSDVT